jgi:hypothetical protein
VNPIKRLLEAGFYHGSGVRRRDNYVPDVSALELDIIEVDAETKDMLKMMDFQGIPGLQLTNPKQAGAGGAAPFRT